MFVNELFCDSYGCPPPVNVTNQINKGIYSQYQLQKIEILRLLLPLCFISCTNYRL